jgi:hypothetical protein
MLIFAVGLCEGGEHAINLLVVSVSVSMSMQHCEKTGSTPGSQRKANRDVIEFRRFYLTVPHLKTTRVRFAGLDE